jgi:hypothetical protein
MSSCRHKISVLRVWKINDLRKKSISLAPGAKQPILLEFSNKKIQTLYTLETSTNFFDMQSTASRGEITFEYGNQLVAQHTAFSKTPNSYSILNSCYNTEDYVKLDIPKPLRSTIAMFSCGVFPLQIET